MDSITLWFGALPLLGKSLLVLLALPVFFLFIGAVTLIGMGTGAMNQEFGPNAKFSDVLFGTTALGVFVVVVFATVFGSIMLLYFLLSLILGWMGIRI